MTTAFRLTDRDLAELDCIALYGNIAYEVGGAIWTRLKQMEQAGLVTFVSRETLGYAASDCFELTAKGRRILKGSRPTA